MAVLINELVIKASVDGPGAMPDKSLQQFVAIDNFLIDCILNENHTLESDVTQYPVESGSNITDNVRPLPINVDMECIVSNTPIGLIADQRSSDSKPADDAYALLLRIRDSRGVVTIRTTLRTYENMVLKTLTIPRQSGRGDELRFNATFQQIQVVENKRVVRMSIRGGKKKGVTKQPEPLDMRQIIIDPKAHSWWDPDLGGWRKAANFLKTNPIRTDNTDVTTIENTSKWHLYRGKIETVFQTTSALANAGIAEDDPFDFLQFNSDHPVRKQIIVTLNQCVLEGFTIQRSMPSGNEKNSQGRVLRNRTQ